MDSTTSKQSSSFPYDVLAEIVAHYVAKFRPKGNPKEISGELQDRKIGYLLDLSLASKTLNKICGKYIFSTCILTLRARQGRQAPTILFPEDLADVRDPNSPELRRMNPNYWPIYEGYFKWNNKAIPLRIAHVASKASYIRELYIRDSGDKELPSLPEMIVPELCELLKSMKSLRVVRFRCSEQFPNILHLPLWNALQTVDLKVLDIKGLHPPQGAQTMSMIEEAYFDWRSENVLFLKLLDPVKLVLYSNKLVPPLLKPTSKRLRHLIAEYRDQGCATGLPLLFDLSEVLHASVEIKLAGHCELRRHIASVFWNIAELARHAFAEGLDRYNTRREDAQLTISRPALALPDDPDVDPSSIDVQPDFVPAWKMHLYSVEEYNAETEYMMEYYARRQRQREY